MNSQWCVLYHAAILEDLPLVSLATTSAVDTLFTTMSVMSSTLNFMLWSGPVPTKGVEVSLSPLARFSDGVARCTILSNTEALLESRVEEENIPQYCSPLLVIIVVERP